MSELFGAKILDGYREKFYKEFSERIVKESHVFDMVKGVAVEAIS